MLTCVFLFPVVLIALWYCYKRGREVRLENERLVTEAEINKMNEESEQHIRPTETLSTTAPRDASISDVRDGIEQIQKARQEDSRNQTPVMATAEVSTATNPAPSPISTNNVAAPTRTPTTGRKNSDKNRFSIFRTFSKRTKTSDPTIQPYPDA